MEGHGAGTRPRCCLWGQSLEQSILDPSAEDSWCHSAPLKPSSRLWVCLPFKMCALACPHVLPVGLGLLCPWGLLMTVRLFHQTAACGSGAEMPRQAELTGLV